MKSKFKLKKKKLPITSGNGQHEKESAETERKMRTCDSRISKKDDKTSILCIMIKETKTKQKYKTIIKECRSWGRG